MKRPVNLWWLRMATWLGPLVLAGALTAAEMRTWTSVEGKVMEATYVRLDGDNVVLLTKESREVKVPKARLSKTDQDYLKEIGAKPSGFAPSKPDKPARLVVPAKEVKIDPKTFVKREAPLEIPQVTFVDVMESPHFVVASTGKLRAKDTAENAERLWHEMAFIHPTFAEKWVDKKMAIIIATDDEAYDDIGAWYASSVKSQGHPDDAERIKKSWPQSSGGAARLDPDVADKNKLQSLVRVFRITKPEWEKEFTRGVWVPFRTHTLSIDLLQIQIGGISGFASKGEFWLTNGFGYYKEFQLCGETQTNLLRVLEDSSNAKDEVAKAGRFDNPKDWVTPLKKYLRSTKTPPKLSILYELKVESLKATDCALAYAFNYYLQSTPERVEKYSEAIKRISTNLQVPDPEELAKIYGFENAAAFEADWIAWMNSPAFK